MFHRVKSAPQESSNNAQRSAPQTTPFGQPVRDPAPQQQRNIFSQPSNTNALGARQAEISEEKVNVQDDVSQSTNVVAEAQQQTTPANEPQEKDVTMSESNTAAQAEQNEDKLATKPADIPAATYAQQPANQRPATPYMSGGSYPGYAGAKSDDGRARYADQGVERRLVIGQGITMSGEIESCDHLLVEGTIEAALKGAKVLEVSESGTFYGTVEIGDATIAGRFEGDLTVDGRLVLKSGGVITGSISYRELQVEAGAIIDGKLTPLRASNASSEDKKPGKPKAAAEKKAKPDAANAEGQLFAEPAAAE